MYPKSRHAAWSLCEGVVNTLRRMGHEVIGAGLPQGGGDVDQRQFDAIKAKAPTLEQLKTQDLVIVSGSEHIGPWLDAIYAKYEWKNLPVPKAAWYHESFSRDDYAIDFDAVKWWAEEHFFPAAQDAEFHDQEMFAKEHSHWLPFGVDTKVFHDRAADVHGWDLPTDTSSHSEKVWPIAFIGLLYEKRRAFLGALLRHDHPPIRLGNVHIEDLSGWCGEEAVRRLASNYRQIGVFFNLPAMSRLQVTKIYEVMACGTFCLTPLLPSDRGTSQNMTFENGRHCVYYRSSNLPYVAQLLREWSSEEKREEREKIAAAGCAEVHANHSLEKRLAVILEKCGVREIVQ